MRRNIILMNLLVAFFWMSMYIYMPNLPEYAQSLGADAVVADLQRLQAEGRLNSTPQPDDGVTYAQKLGAEKKEKRGEQAEAVGLERRVIGIDHDLVEESIDRSPQARQHLQ